MAGETGAHHGSVQEGVDVEHGLQLQGVIQAVVLVAFPATNARWETRRRRFQVGKTLLLSPVHASQSQVDVGILEQHSREEVLLGGMDQERRVYDLHTHRCVFMSTESVLSCDGTTATERGGSVNRGGVWRSLP